ncbi:unnamed protein product [Candida verbasci]|uniref:Protein kinase C-like 1 n=1 Tax=Candida verbasci TaxID=1227364 RepID=A0A9W4TUM0_9ASCO|nr:unnamed protein product [Candida verbasci]
MSRVTEDVIADIKQKISVEQNIIQGFQDVKKTSTNPEVIQKCKSKIIESQSIIDYYQDSLNKLTKQLQRAQINDNNSGQRSFSDRSSVISEHKPVYSRLDLIKYECPSLGHKIQHMLQQLEFKVQVENQYREANKKISHLYLMDGDKSSSNAAEGSRTESDQRLQLLEKALKKYQSFHINSEDFNRDFEIMDTPKHARKSLSGRLTISVTCIRDIDHIAGGKFRKRETYIVIKIDDVEKARTKTSKNDNWNEEIIIDVEKSHEVEISIMDKQGSNSVPVAINWFSLYDLAEEIRKKKAAKDQGSNGWLTASNLPQTNGNSINSNTFNSNLGLPQSDIQPPRSPIQSSPPQDSNQKVSINTWLSLEPCGQILINLNFEKSLSEGKQFRGPLGRHGAIRQKKEEVFEQQGHQFVQKQFYNIMSCALCGEFLRYTGYQCQDCKFLCHRKCYQKVVTKCISKSGADYDAAQLKHRIPHRFGPVANHGTKWCCHCGYILPWGKKNIRKCTECGVMCHAQCTHLVPDFCGMSLQMANEILATIKSTKVSPKKSVQVKPLPPKPPITTLPSLESNHTYVEPEEENEKEYEVKLPTTTKNVYQEPVEMEKTRRRPPINNFDLSFDNKEQLEYRQPKESIEIPIIEENENKEFDNFDYNNQVTQNQIVPQEIISPFVDQKIEEEVKPKKPKTKKRRRKIGLDDFQFLAVLGKGNFGKVMLAESRHTQKLCAIKVLKKDFIVENDEAESVKSEKRVFLTANKEMHPFLLNLHCCFQTENRIYFVMEYISGGDLMWHIQKNRFTAKRAKFYACEVLLGLKYFHDNGIVYRDLKLDNILLTIQGHIKIGDYGLCKENMWESNTTSTFCGTPEFMAPEIVAGKNYNRSVDWWAFGVLLFQMLLCQSPFKGDDEDDIFNAIEHDEVKYPISLSRQTVLVLQALLTKDPSQRLGSGPRDAEEIMEHPYFHDVNFDDVLNCRIPAPYIPEIQSEHDYSNFDQEFTSETPRLTPVETVLTSEMQEQFRGFSHISDNATI